jgi:probable HAF family extracellular repeat protein
MECPLRRPKHLFLLVAALAGAALPAGLVSARAGAATAARSTPTAIDVGTLGGSYSFASAVSESGQVVGYSYTAGDVEPHAFSWTNSGGMVDLGTLGGTYSETYAVNASGQVIGYSYTADDAAIHATLWQP